MKRSEGKDKRKYYLKMIAYERDATLLRFFEVRNTKICDEYNIQYTIGSKKTMSFYFITIVKIYFITIV